MAKKRKRNKKAAAPKIEEVDTIHEEAPKSLVVRMGRTGRYVKQLKQNMRLVMSPYTALKLQEGSATLLKDFKTLASDFKVSHLMIFTQTDVATWMRIARNPAGPTLTFRVHTYSTMKDVVSLQKRPITLESGKDATPMLMMNGFPTDQPHYNLTTVLLQSMFPPVVVKQIQLKKCKRVVLFSYNPETNRVDFRHYFIRVQGVGLTRGVANVMKKNRKLPNMGKLRDISDYVLKPTADGSDSEMEDTPETRVTIEGKHSSKHISGAPQSAVRLVELGPRMSLELVKIQEGFCDGKVLYHSYVQKSPQEIKELEKKIQEKIQLKEMRRREQEENIMKKKAEKGEKNEFVENEKEEEEDQQEEEEEDEEEKELKQEMQYYKEATGEEIDPALLKDFKEPKKKKNKYNPLYKKKKQKTSDNKSEE